MIAREPGLTVGVRPLWAGAWIAWAAVGALLPLPPWSADERIAAERAAAERALAAVAAPVWSADVGGPHQASALGRGWSAAETLVENGRRRSFVWVEGPVAEIAFAAPGWPQARLSLDAAPLDTLAPLAVDVLLDGEVRARLEVAGGWGVSHVDLGAVSAGRHTLGLRPLRRGRAEGDSRTLSVAVAGLAVGAAAVDEPDRDRGVFTGTLAIGLDDRPALFVTEGVPVGALPSGTAMRAVEPGLTAFYAFGIGRPAGSLSAALAVVHGVLGALLLVFLTGLGWSLLFTGHRPVSLVLAVGCSTLVLGVAFVALRATTIGVSASTLAAALLLLGGLPLLGARGAVSLPWIALGSGLVALLPLACFATSVVPPLEDQDMEVQGTAHALATQQVPAMLTNRGTAIFFAHPPLLHVWVSGSFALSGRLERVAGYHDAAITARQVPFVEPEPDAPISERPHYAAWQELFRRFLAEPQLWPTRQVNVVLSAFAVGLLARLAAAQAGSVGAGLALAGVLLTFPEFLIRGSYGGYFAAASLLSLLVVGALDRRCAGIGAAGASALACLADQKGALVAAAWAVAAPWSAGWRRLVPLGGAVGALALFAAYGWAVDARSFSYDFLQEHVLRRLAPTDVRFTAGGAHSYPSIPALWVEFGAHYGLLFTAWVAWATLKCLRSERPAARAAAASVLLGAVVFSLTDWRQTKHLAQVVPLGLVAIAAAWPRSERSGRLAWAAAILVIAWNLWTAWPLLSDFSALRPSTIW